MGCCRGSYQTWITVIMSYNIIQILIHFTLMIIELMIYNCYDILEEDEAQVSLYAFYFFNKDCPSEIVNRTRILGKISKAYYAQRTEILAILNIVVDSLWLILTISVLVFHCAKKTPRSYFWTIVIWMVLAAVGNLNDLISVILYIVDVAKAKGVSYYGVIESKNNILTEKNKLAPVIMMVTAGRFFIFFILNIAAWIYVVIVSKKVEENTSSRPKQRTVPLKPPKPAIKNARPTHLQEDNIPRVEDWYKHYENNNKPDVTSNFIPTLNNRSYASSSSDSDPYRQPQNQNNFNNGHPSTLGSPANVMINGVPSGTLRRQLPWSYVHEPGVYPRRQMRQIGADAPPVPVPDYTLRLHGNPKFENPRWSQYPQPPPPPAPKPNWRGLNRY